MFDLEKREKSILLVLLIILLIGLAFTLYQKRAVHVDVKSDGFTDYAEDPSSRTLKININESDAAGLMELKGVGRILAERIIEYRSTNGNFRSVEELKKVKGVGQKLYEKIKDGVSID
ncbi:MAG: helix-hairpin-helix domain-containing protein [Candidatus Omnitrophota bacterium]|nr:helix-hairpin-helix domain-containing protein [Candidatus Omnitrophota bacterium]